MIPSRSRPIDPLETLSAHSPADSATAHSEHPLPVESDEQRSAPRFTLLIRSAKLVSPDSEYLCVVRDASESGVSVRLFHPLPPEVPLALEMPNGDILPLERVWEEEGKAGFRFNAPVDIARIVESPSQFARRGVRVRIVAEGMPEVAGKVRWRRNDDYGLSFEDTFQFAELAALAFDLQRDARKAA